MYSYINFNFFSRTKQWFFNHLKLKITLINQGYFIPLLSNIALS